MKLELDRFKSDEAFILQTDKIGSFLIAAPTTDDSLALSKEYQKTRGFEKINSIELAQFIIKRLAFHLVENNVVKEEDPISDKELNQFVDGDFELFSKLYIENHPWLPGYRFNIIVRSKSEGQEQKSNFKKDEIKIEKKKEESHCDYLKRLLQKHYEIEEKDYQKLIASFKPLIDQSEKMKQLLNTNFSLSKELAESIHSIQTPYQSPILDSLKNLRPNPSVVTNEILSRIDNTIERLSNVSLQSSTIVLNINEIIKELLNQNQRTSKKNTIISFVMIAVAVISMIIGTVFSYQNLIETRKNGEQLNFYLNEIYQNNKLILKEKKINDSLNAILSKKDNTSTLDKINKVKK